MPSQKNDSDFLKVLDDLEAELPSFGGFPRMNGFARMTPIEIDHESTPAGTDPNSDFVAKAAFKVYTSVVAADGSGDYETIAEALANLPVSGGSIFIKQGTYIVEELHIDKNNVILTGDGTGTLLQKDSNDSKALIRISGQSNIKIENMSLDNNATTNNPPCINIESASSEIRIFNVTVEGKGEGILVGPDTGGTLVDKVFIMNSFISSDGGFRAAITFGGCKNISVSNCFITAPNTNGDGLAFNYETSAIERIIVNNCNIEDCAANGISMTSDTNFLVITSCVVQSNDDGIVFQTDGNHAKTIINSNQIIDNSGTGLDIGNTSDRIITTSNIILNNTTANLTDNGTNGVTANNITA